MVDICAVAGLGHFLERLEQVHNRVGGICDPERDPRNHGEYC